MVHELMSSNFSTQILLPEKVTPSPRVKTHPAPTPQEHQCEPECALVEKDNMGKSSVHPTTVHQAKPNLDHQLDLCPLYK